MYVGDYNPDTGTFDYDPNHLPETEDGFHTAGVAMVGIELRLPTGDVVKINEDDYIHEMVVEMPDKTVKTFAGRLHAVCGSTRYQEFAPRFYNPKGPQLRDYIRPQMLVIDSSKAHESILHYIPIMKILSVGEVESADELGVTIVGPGLQYAKLSTVIESLDDGAVVELLSGDYSEDLAIKKSITIRARGEATLTGHITVGETGQDGKLEVSFQGIDFVDRATISVLHTTSFTLDNCVFTDNVYEDQTATVLLTEPNPCYVKITNNTFGAPYVSGCENAIVINSNLTEDSKIDNNRFDDGCCTGDTIVLYGLDRNGDISVSHNSAHMSANLVHIGFRGVVNGRLHMEGNAYDFTNTNEDYAGLFVVRSAGRATETMYMLDISVDDTENNSGVPQIGYFYADEGDTPWTSETMPKIYIDGYLVDLPIRGGTSGNIGAYPTDPGDDEEISDQILGGDTPMVDDPNDIENPSDGDMVFDEIGDGIGDDGSAGIQVVDLS